MSTFQNGGITYNKLVFSLNSTNYTFIGTLNTNTAGNGTNSGTSLSPPTTDPTLVIPSTDDAGNTVIGIMAGAFRNCTNLQKLVLPDTIRYIGVTNVNSGVVTIDQTSSAKGSFEGCTGLVHIKLSENSLFTHIPPNSFKDCKSLVAIRIPSNVNYIGSNAFSNGLFLKDVMICGNPDISKSYVSGSYTNGVFGNNASDSPANQNIYSTQQWKNNYFNIEYHSYWDNSGSSNLNNINNGYIAKWHLYDSNAYLKVPAFQDFGNFNDTTFYPAGTGSVDNVNLDEDIQNLSNVTANQKSKTKQIRKLVISGTGTNQRIYACGQQTVIVSNTSVTRSIVMRFLMNGNIDTNFGDSAVSTDPNNSARTGTLTIALNDNGAEAQQSGIRYMGAGNYETSNYHHYATDIIDIPSGKNLFTTITQPTSLIAICGWIGFTHNSTTVPNIEFVAPNATDSNKTGTSTSIGYVAVIDCDIDSNNNKYGQLWSGANGWGAQWSSNQGLGSQRIGFLTFRQDYNSYTYQDGFFNWSGTKRGINTDSNGNPNLATGTSNASGVSHTFFRTDYDFGMNPPFSMVNLYAPNVKFYNLYLAPKYNSIGSIFQYSISVVGTTSVYKMGRYDYAGTNYIRMFESNQANRRDALLMARCDATSSYGVGYRDILIRKINYKGLSSSLQDTNNNFLSNWGNGWDYNLSSTPTLQSPPTDTDNVNYYPDADVSMSILHPNFNETITVLDTNSPHPDMTTSGANDTVYSRNSIHIGFNLKSGVYDDNATSESDGFFPRIETFYLDNSGSTKSFIHYGKSINSQSQDTYLPSIQKQSLYQITKFGGSGAPRYNDYLLKSMIICDGTNQSTGIKRLILCESGEGKPINTTLTTTGIVNIGSIDISHNTTIPTDSTNSTTSTHPEGTYNDFVFGKRAGFLMKTSAQTSADLTNDGAGGYKGWHEVFEDPDRATATQGRDYYYTLNGASPGNSHVQTAVLDNSTGLRYLSVFTNRFTSGTNIDIHTNKIPVQRKLPISSSENPNQNSSTYIPSGYPTITDLSSNASDNVRGVVIDSNSKIYVGGYLSSLMGNVGANTHPFLFSLRSTKTTDIRLPFTFQFNITTNEYNDISINRTNTHTYQGSNGFAYSGKSQTENLPIYNGFAQDTMKFTNITSTVNGNTRSYSVEGFALPDILHSNDGFLINTEQSLHTSINTGQGDRHRSVAGGYDDVTSNTSIQNKAKIDFTNVNLTVTKWGNIPFSKGWHGHALRKSSATSADLRGDKDTPGGTTNTHVHGIFDEGFKNTSTNPITAIAGGSNVATGNKNQDKPAILANTCWAYAWQSSSGEFIGGSDNSFCNPPVDMQYWDISNVTTLRCAFKNTTRAGCAVQGTTGYLSDWNTSNVTDMWGTFYEAGAFNQDISAWNTSNVTDMAYMFYKANVYNNNSIGPINWNCDKVTNMSYMYKDAVAFNRNIGSWLVSNVLSFNNMFGGATAFNVNGGSLTYWNVKNATDFTDMFNGASSFTDNLIQYWRIDSTDTITNIVSNSGITGTPSISQLNQYAAYNQTRPVHYVNTDSSASNIVDYSITNGVQTQNSMTFGSDTIVFGKDVTSVNNNKNLTGVRMIIFEPKQTGQAEQDMTVVTIQPNAFEGCTNLETVILPMYNGATHSTNTTANPLGNATAVFKGCTKLQNIIHPVTYFAYGNTGVLADGPPNMFINTKLNDPNANIILAAGWYMSEDASYNLAYHGLASTSPTPYPTSYHKYTPNSADANTILTNGNFTLKNAYFTSEQVDVGGIMQTMWRLNATKFASLTTKLTESQLYNLHSDFKMANLLRAGYYGLTSFICFLTGTKIKTDQGYLAIETLDKKRHTIDGHKIKVITTTTYERNKLVCIKKDALFKNCPCEDTYLTGDHKIFYKGKMTKAEDVVNKKSIVFVNMIKPVVYNIALEKEGEGKLVANNIIAETLDPENVLVYLYLFIEDKYVSDNHKMNAKRLFGLIMNSETREERGRLIKQLFSIFKEAKKQNTKAPVAPKIFKL